MSDLFSYLSWFQVVLLMVAFMSGILSLVREWALIHTPGKVDEGRLFWSCARAAFIMSALSLWGMEHHSVMSLHQQLNDLTKPQLIGTIDQVAFAPSGTDNSWTVTTISGEINNKGAPTILNHWKASLRLADGEVIKGEGVPPPMPGGELVLYFGEGSNIKREFPEADHFLIQSESHPIATGGGISGWVQFVFRVKKQNTLGALMTVSFADINGDVHLLTYDVGSTQSVPIDLNEIEKQGKQ
jgi:hypothetical protein